ncbi:MAG TPA: MMPL family transporter [Solirubrobacterales bacterium]|jgi:RND superfamily putative drug exporter|nr:MMPL family transporter [Solirubrobacterales bacterium]
MRQLGHWCTTHRRTVILSWIVALIAIGFAAGSAGSSFSQNFELSSSDSQRAVDLLKKRFPAQSGDTATIVYRAPGGVGAPAVKRRMRAVFAEVEGVPHVSGVSSPYGGAGTAAIGKNGEIAYATVQFDQPTNKLPKEDIRRVIDIGEAAAGPGLQVELGGQPIEQARQEKGNTSFGIGLLAAIIVLLITFGSVVAMGLPVLTALFALGVGLSLVTLGTHVLDTAEFAPQLAAMIGLGVGIDYALFILTRFRDGLDEGLEPQPAAVRSIDTAGRAVLFAGVTVIIALLGMLLLGVTFLYGVAVAAALAVLMTMIAALTLLPALLTIAGRRVDRLRLPGLGKRKAGRVEESRWYRWSSAIQRRPVIAMVLSGGLLLVLCIPTLSLRLGSSDAGSDPAGSTTRQAYDLLAEGFGPGFNGPFQVVVDLPHAGEGESLAQLSNAIERQPGVAKVTPAALNPAKDTGVVQAYPTTSPQSEATTQLLRHLRSDVIPPIERRTGAAVYIGGATATFEDFGNVLTEKLPLFIGVVVLLSALLLMAVFRSVLVPLKAMLMNLLSIGAAFGVVVAVFQWGWLGNLIGVDSTGPIESFLPVFLFAIVFGLSMDYEVFLMSRIHEEWESRKDATSAVTQGLALTGRVITAAAAIMVTVFASFMLGEDRIIKLFGLGLSAAVLIDAVVIRSVLVPAIMQLFGARAWWIPAWLNRILPRLSVEPHHDAAAPGVHPTGEPALGESEG